MGDAVRTLTVAVVVSHQVLAAGVPCAFSSFSSSLLLDNKQHVCKCIR
jgi:hypothetical protein